MATTHTGNTKGTKLPAEPLEKEEVHALLVSRGSLPYSLSTLSSQPSALNSQPSALNSPPRS